MAKRKNKNSSEKRLSSEKHPPEKLDLNDRQKVQRFIVEEFENTRKALKRVQKSRPEHMDYFAAAEVIESGLLQTGFAAGPLSFRRNRAIQHPKAASAAAAHRHASSVALKSIQIFDENGNTISWVEIRNILPISASPNLQFEKNNGKIKLCKTAFVPSEEIWQERIRTTKRKTRNELVG